MFVLRRLYSRRVSSVKYVRKSMTDPGIFRQKNVLKGSNEEIEFTDFDELESDFMTVHKSHKEHLEEMERWKEKEKYLIVKQKYFKEQLPNFLTWHDKEQIRYLHNTNPEEWTIERLSEGFPAFPDIIKKIANAKWTKKDQNRISRHDKTVLQNWNDFKQGKLNNLPQELKEHLQKFTNRTLNVEPFSNPDNKQVIISNEIKKPYEQGEFSEIITSYQQLKKSNQDRSEGNTNIEFAKNKISVNPKIKAHHKLVTFKELQVSIDKKMLKGKEISVQDKLIKEASFPQKETLVELKQEDISNIVEHRHETNSDKVGFVRKTTRDVSHLIYPERITIPPDIYKRGYTYKLNDCYYDSDGEFLYRVPGMS